MVVLVDGVSGVCLSPTDGGPVLEAVRTVHK